MRLQRRPFLRLAGIALGVFLGFPAVAQNTGLDLFHKMQQALGGAAKIAAIHDLDWTVMADTFDHDGKVIGRVIKRTRWIRPNYLRLDQIGPGDTYVLYFDGTGGWEILPDKRMLALAGGELEFARGYLSGFLLNQWLADRSGGFVITSPSPNVVRLSANGKGTDITLDPVSYLPVKTLGISLADPSRPATSEGDTLEWMRVQGVSFPAHLRNSSSGDGSADIRTEKLLLNSALNPQVLAIKPADLKPVVAP